MMASSLEKLPCHMDFSNISSFALFLFETVSTFQQNSSKLGNIILLFITNVRRLTIAPKDDFTIPFGGRPEMVNFDALIS